MADADAELNEKLSALGTRVSGAFSQQCVEGALHALQDKANPLRLNFFCTAMRTLFEHTMGLLAPDENIVCCSWFAPQNEKGIPTKGQRIIFAIQGGLTDAFVKEKLSVDVDGLRKTFVDAVDDLSKHVHGRENTLVTNTEEQNSFAIKVTNSFDAFLSTYDACRSAILDPITEALDDDAVSAFVGDTIESIDELASHYSIEEIYVNSIAVGNIGAHEITYNVEGTISVTLQWGSNSDLRRGDGAELDQKFDFFYDVKVPLEDPWDLTVAEACRGVDTRDWWDAMKPDET